MKENRNIAPHPEFDSPAYSLPEVARLLHIKAARIRNWVTGYDYKYDRKDGKTVSGRQKSILRGAKSTETPYASFLDLIDLHFVKEFLEKGYSLQKVRKCLDEAGKLLGTTHFAHHKFFTDGKTIALELKDEGKPIMELDTGGQLVIREVTRQLNDCVDFDDVTEFVSRWYPRSKSGLVVLDPLISFGRPCIAQKGVSTASVYDLYVGEDEKTDPVCDWFNLSRNQVMAAVNFEKGLMKAA